MTLSQSYMRAKGAQMCVLFQMCCTLVDRFSNTLDKHKFIISIAFSFQCFPIDVSFCYQIYLYSLRCFEPPGPSPYLLVVASRCCHQLRPVGLLPQRVGDCAVLPIPVAQSAFLFLAGSTSPWLAACRPREQTSWRTWVLNHPNLCPNVRSLVFLLGIPSILIF